MKMVILHFALIAIAIATTSEKSQAQLLSAVTGDEKINCSAVGKVAGQTIIDGNWEVLTDTKGNLVVTNKDNQVVRMIAKTSVNASYQNDANATDDRTSNVSLVIDKCGNLHLTDNTVYYGSPTVAPVLIQREVIGWGDPESMDQIITPNTMVSVKK